jgi:hypothetical protein
MRALAGSGTRKQGILTGVLVLRHRHIIFGFHLSVLGLGFCLAVVSAGCRIFLTARNKQEF